MPVAATPVTRADVFVEVAFNAELRPWQEIELHAKVTGFVEAITVDAGDVVKNDQLLATLEVPEQKLEIDHALASQRRAKAEVDHAQATFDEAHSVYTRLSATDKAQPKLIAAQDMDNAKMRDRSAEAALVSSREAVKVAETEVKKMQTMLDYARITAPFAGVVTKRYASVGALIQAGTSSGALPLVRLSQNDKLRVAFPISASFVSRVKIGDPVELRVAGINRTLNGKVARFTRKVETATRTMEAEVDVENTDLSLIPGMYASAVLKLDRREKALVVPVEAVLREKTGATVYVVNKDNKIEERTVTVGLETPTKVEILSGLAENDLVMIGSRAQIAPGQTVQPKLIEVAKAN
ncbi:MAG: efflux RND transporter periplasmic adaptor subunit [Verrucomicrobiaceae bacterium]|nr:efflux RND transporter periplasmic adaptor subunit [Verrucomicrobiaceae bacterium]